MANRTPPSLLALWLHWRAPLPCTSPQRQGLPRAAPGSPSEDLSVFSTPGPKAHPEGPQGSYVVGALTKAPRTSLSLRRKRQLEENPLLWASCRDALFLGSQRGI